MNYIGNELQWKRLIEVDWLGQYVKAWVAFNAWYSNNFKPPQKDKRLSDGKIIEKIKNDEGDICSKIENFLSGTSSDQKSFQSDVADLHNALSRITIRSKRKRIWFQQISDYQEKKSIENNRSGITYKIKIDENNKSRQIGIYNRLGENIFKEIITSDKEESFQGEKWFEKLIDQGIFAKLTPPQRNHLKVLIEDSSPIHNLLAPDNAPTEIGPYNFTSDKNLIARGLIEILYQLRNSLFHGEITPNQEVQTVYQPAYLVLKQIIPGA